MRAGADRGPSHRYRKGLGLPNHPIYRPNESHPWFSGPGKVEKGLVRGNLDSICRTTWLPTRGGTGFGRPVTLSWRLAQVKRETREGHVFVPVENWKLLLPLEEGSQINWSTDSRALCSTDQGVSTTCIYRYQGPHQAMQKGAYVVGRGSPAFQVAPLEPGQGLNLWRARAL